MNLIFFLAIAVSIVGIYFGQKYSLHANESKKLSTGMFILYLAMFILSCILLIVMIVMLVFSNIPKTPKPMSSNDFSKKYDIGSAQRTLQQQYATYYAFNKR